jgi:putative transposase
MVVTTHPSLKNQGSRPCTRIQPRAFKDAIRVDAGQLRGHIDEAVRSSVEETLNGFLDAEADRICGAERYQRSADRVDTRAGHYERQLETKAGSVKLKVPKLRSLLFETAIIERYHRREASIEKSLVEMYLARVSVRRVEDITEALWGTHVSSGTVSRLKQKIYRHIEVWRNRTIEGDFPYLNLDGVCSIAAGPEKSATSSCWSRWASAPMDFGRS